MSFMINNPERADFADYLDFARAVYETGVLSDPWLDGDERFCLEGIVLEPERAAALNEAAERVAYLHQELVEILIQNPKLQSDFYHLTPCQQLMWEAAGGLWHGMARADLFICEDGRITCCELNSDTPSGQPEAVILNRLLRGAHKASVGDVHDPNELMGTRYVAMLRESHAKNTSALLGTVGIIYPTELTEDLAMITLFTRWLEAAGIRVVRGSPFNLRRTARGIEVLGEHVDLIVRHYKTDWWGERLPVWDDAADYPDPLPLSGPLGALLSAEMNGEVTVVNPFGSVVTQNKLSLAFFWEQRKLFSRRAQKWIQKYIPETFRLTTIGLKRLQAEQDQWVLKSDYGCEGQETVCGPFVSQEIWRKSLEHARPQHFVAQRFFRARRDAVGRLANYGVYLLGGSANGYFTRLSRQSTEYRSVTAPTFIAPASAETK
jgi:glutathionylspermidine synthase